MGFLLLYHLCLLGLLVLNDKSTLCQYHAILITTALQCSLILDSLIPPALLFFLKIAVAIWGLS